MKLFYFHIPKTAGSSFNQFLSSKFINTLTHIESQSPILSKEFCNHFDFLSGHLDFFYMDKLINLEEWITFATFREPISHTVSHLKWVRKLADKGQEERLKNHNKLIQRVATEMKNYDFSDANQISDFSNWLISTECLFFHDTQARFMSEKDVQIALTTEKLEQAIKNMQSINFVGIQDRLEDYLKIIGYEFGWQFDKQPRLNVNNSDYGFNLEDPDTREALLPLYRQDLILYQEAKKSFENLFAQYQNDSSDYWGYVDAFHNNILRGWIRYTGSLKKVTVEVRINHQHYTYVTANLYRKDLLVNKVHPSGRCAFEVKIPEGVTLEQCDVLVPGTSFVLENSAIEDSKE